MNFSANLERETIFERTKGHSVSTLQLKFSVCSVKCQRGYYPLDSNRDRSVHGIH